jgi:excinuclease ABC subunit C
LGTAEDTRNFYGDLPDPRTCSESNFKTAQRTKRQCLMGDIGKCAAPCVEWISESDHKKLASDLITFLEKSPEDIAKRVEEEMQIAAEREDFEKAARLRDQLNAINKAFESTDRFLNENIDAGMFWPFMKTLPTLRYLNL